MTQNTNSTFNFFNYSVTPELNDSLVRGALYQKDLLQTGNSFANSIGIDTSNTSSFRSFTYPVASPTTGPLLRQIQGADGFRYLLARFDGDSVLASSVYTPNAGTSATTLRSIGFDLTYDSAASPTTAYTYYPYFNGITSTTAASSIQVFISDNISDSITISSLNNLTLYTFGGFVYGTTSSATPATYLNGSWYLVPPTSFVNGKPYLQAYTAPTVSGTKTTWSYRVNVGDYAWLQLYNSGNVTQETKEVKKK